MRFVMVVVGSYQPLMQSLLTTAQACVLPPIPFHLLPYSCQGFKRPKNQQTKNNSIFEDHVRSSGVFEVTASSEEGCLNTLRLFSLGGELHFIVSFLVEEIATKLNHVFIV